jgi:acyl-CoA thioester hydrolase
MVSVMTGDWPDLAGRLIAGGHLLPVRVYFEDTDFSGVVYHGSYIRFLERGRTDFLRLLGIGHDALDRGDHGRPLAFAVRRMTIDFHKPARIDDLLEVETLVGSLAGARIHLSQSVRRAGDLLVAADVTVALIDAAGKPRRFPAAVAGRLAAARRG